MARVVEAAAVKSGALRLWSHNRQVRGVAGLQSARNGRAERAIVERPGLRGRPRLRRA